MVKSQPPHGAKLFSLNLSKVRRQKGRQKCLSGLVEKGKAFWRNVYHIFLRTSHKQRRTFEDMLYVLHFGEDTKVPSIRQIKYDDKFVIKS